MTLLISLFILQGGSIILSILKVISRSRMTNILRFSYGAFLIFSGMVKILDPLGFSYKLQEYFEVFGLEWFIPLTLSLSICICLFEIFIGFFLVYGIYIKQVLWSNLVLMIGFTFLTFYSAYFNAVTDCGCFGDFMKLEPWFSFQKDIVLLIVSVVLFLNHLNIKPLFTSHNSLVFIFLIVLFIPVYALSHLPFVDFRAYKIGNSIIEGRILPDDAKQDIYEDVWFYQIEGEVKEFSTSEKPWAIPGAIFKDRKTNLVVKGDEPLISDFEITDYETGFDMTDSILGLNKVVLLISYDIEKTKISAHQAINSDVVKLLNNYDIPIYGLSASSVEDIKDKILVDELEYQYFSVDQTTLKTMIRSNPGLILLENGVVTQKLHWRDLPRDWLKFINQ